MESTQNMCNSNSNINAYTFDEDVCWCWQWWRQRQQRWCYSLSLCCSITLLLFTVNFYRLLCIASFGCFMFLPQFLRNLTLFRLLDLLTCLNARSFAHSQARTIQISRYKHWLLWCGNKRTMNLNCLDGVWSSACTQHMYSWAMSNLWENLNCRVSFW